MYWASLLQAFNRIQGREWVISARDMHRKERSIYEQTEKDT